MSAFTTEISSLIWDTKYRFRGDDGTGDRTVQDTWSRIARARFSRTGAALGDGVLPRARRFQVSAGRTYSNGAGTGRRVTLFNCFVMGTITDSMDGIFEGLKEGALTMLQGGGVGYDYRYAFEHGLEDCTTYRPNVITGAVLEAPAEETRLCCVPEREADQLDRTGTSSHV